MTGSEQSREPELCGREERCWVDERDGAEVRIGRGGDEDAMMAQLRKCDGVNLRPLGGVTVQDLLGTRFGNGRERPRCTALGKSPAR